jgi:peptidoglycan/LPS O-acetylase OafA/YrhL
MTVATAHNENACFCCASTTPNTKSEHRRSIAPRARTSDLFGFAAFAVAIAAMFFAQQYTHTSGGANMECVCVFTVNLIYYVKAQGHLKI